MTHSFLAFLPHFTVGGLISKTVLRLILAAFLGGIIGLERELKHRAAGLRTNMFICFGAAMFTILSEELAGQFVGDHTRIAAQIIPGIGFIGAGSILHNKSGVTGLTTAATLFVVASIGMACGGGLYLPAIFATMLMFLSLEALGWVERRLNLKPLVMNYTILTENASDDLVAEVNSLLEDFSMTMQGMRVTKTNGKKKLVFGVEGTRIEHKELMDRLRTSPELSNFSAVRGFEHE